MNEDTIMQFSLSGSKYTIILVSGEVKIMRIFAGDSSDGVKARSSNVPSKNLTNKKYVLWNVYLPNVVRCIPYTIIEIFDYNCNDLELDRFKVI